MDTAETKIQVNATKIENNAKAITGLGRHDGKQWEEISKLRDRLNKLVPVWIVIVMSVMSFVCGSALTTAVIVVKLVGNK